MMTKEEVASIVAYCDEHRISFKQRLEELGIPGWRFYEAKRRYSVESEGGQGEFLQLAPGTFSPAPVLSRRPRAGKSAKTEASGMVSIEMKTRGGTLLRIQGEMTPSMLSSIINASGGHVQS